MTILKVTASVSICSLFFFILAGPMGCAASSDGDSSDQSGALQADASRKYAALAGTWNALDAVPPASADGIPSYTTYTFARDGSFTAARGATTVTGTWQIFTTLPTLPRIDMTWGGTRETYVFSLQCDLLVLDGVDALFQHDLASLPVVADGAICEDASWSSLARCPPDIGDCDHETHRCLQPS